MQATLRLLVAAGVLAMAGPALGQSDNGTITLTGSVGTTVSIAYHGGGELFDGTALAAPAGPLNVTVNLGNVADTSRGNASGVIGATVPIALRGNTRCDVRVGLGAGTDLAATGGDELDLYDFYIGFLLNSTETGTAANPDQLYIDGPYAGDVENNPFGTVGFSLGDISPVIFPILREPSPVGGIQPISASGGHTDPDNAVVYDVKIALQPKLYTTALASFTVELDFTVLPLP